MIALSKSHAKTLALAEAGKVDEAAKEFREHFIYNFKSFYSEAADAYPDRFNKIKKGNWPDWTKRLYNLTREIDNTLQQGQRDKALAKLGEIREQFDVMHTQAQARKSNDCIYAFRAALLKGKPQTENLKKLAAAVEKAEPSINAKAKAEKYAKAKAEWSQLVAKIIKDGKITQAEMEQLQGQTEQFYRDFGIQFE